MILIEDEIYYNKAFNKCYIFKYEKNFRSKYHIFNNRDFKSNGDFGKEEILKEIRLATQEEKDWLNECIKQQKFISLEDIKITQSEQFPIY